MTDANPLSIYLLTHNPITTPTAAIAAAAAPTTAPAPAVGAAPADFVLSTALAAATCNPYAVVVTTVPLIVVVTTVVDVVLAVHALQLVQGAAVLHGPAVQPGQSDAGHAVPSHHAVHGPLRQSVRVDHPLYGP